MKKILVAGTSIFLITASLAADPVESLGWMSGTWRAERDGRIIEETWSGVHGGVLLGMHKAIRKDGTVWFEFLRIAKVDGTPAYIAQPGGGQPTIFLLKEHGEHRVLFENLEHDFPQRIIYRREGNELCARVEGDVDGTSRHQEWCWTRVE